MLILVILVLLRKSHVKINENLLKVIGINYVKYEVIFHPNNIYEPKNQSR